MNMREQFEEWSANHVYLGGIELHKSVSGEYADMDLQHAWESWESSRAAIEIALPETPNRGIGYGLFDAAKERCATVLEAAGLRVKQ